MGFITGGAGLILLFNPNGLVGLLNFVSMSGESYLLSPTGYIKPDLVDEIGVHAGLSLGTGRIDLNRGGNDPDLLGKATFPSLGFTGTASGGDDRICRGTSDRFPFL